MRIVVVTPAPPGARTGNRVTALRWAKRLRELGHRVALVERWDGQPCDVLVALHAARSESSIERARHERPTLPIVVGLAGTDVYGGDREALLASLARADRIVALQPLALRALDPALAARGRVIVQSAVGPAPGSAPAGDRFDACVLAHLRGVKDPLLAARAARLLPPGSRVRVLHLGRALDDAAAAEARAEQAANPRYAWLGERPRRETLEHLARARVLVISSRSEGGSNALSEAIAAGVPVLSTRIDGSVGLLGDDHPGLFPAGDAAALAALLDRAERDPAFLAELTRRSEALRPLVEPARERRAWAELLGELAAARPAAERLVVVDGGPAATAEAIRAELAADVRAGLLATPRRLSCRWFYDHDGSLLFEEICRLPEYYVPRAESEILAAHADDLAARMPAGADVVELGSGSATKTRLVLEAFLRRHGRARFVPIDVSRTMLEESSRTLLDEYPALQILAVAGEYQVGLRLLDQAGPPRLVLWLGSNIGNFDRPGAEAFLRGLRRRMRPGDLVLAGIDLRKERAVLERAYDDAQGVTARFNKNLLVRINRELGGTFDLDAFAHRAIYREDLGCVQMYLVSRAAQRVRITALDLELDLAAGEAIHTEDSYKYAPAEIDALAAASGFVVEARWTDAAGRFSDNLLAPA